MYYAVKNVEALSDYKLKLTFSNGVQKLFDVNPYLNLGVFKELSNYNLFKQVHVSFDTIQWPNHADFDPEFLYEKGVEV